MFDGADCSEHGAVLDLAELPDAVLAEGLDAALEVLEVLRLGEVFPIHFVVTPDGAQLAHVGCVLLLRGHHIVEHEGAEGTLPHEAAITGVFLTRRHFRKLLIEQHILRLL